MLHRLYEQGTIHRNSQGTYVDKNDLFKATINVAGHLMCNMAVCGGKKTNFFTLLVTRTGGGKDSIARNMSKLLEHQGWGDHLESNFVSVQGYERVLQLKGGTLFMITDEAAQWFGAFGGKHTSEHYKKLKTALKINYSGGTYASQNAKEGASFIMKNTFVSCSFLGTPAIFQNIREEDIIDGLLGRMLVFHDVNNDWGIDSALLRKGIAFIKPTLPPIEVPATPYELYDKNDDCAMYYDAFRNSMPSPDSLPNDHTFHLMARLPEHFNKLLMLTLNEKGETRLAAARWASSVVIHSYRTACSFIAKDFNKTFFSDALDKMLGLIRSQGEISKGLLRNKHAMRRLDKRLFEETLDALEEMGMVALEEINPEIQGGRPTILITITEKGKQNNERE